ncbi:hypothetical protein HYZ98_01125 [Candidatus Peregrinibacteria bacterium]|nr:hypothetical protein [Candidatus Peregrinibacteria bacterium]
MSMSSLDITFYEPENGVSNADHYQTCLEKARALLEAVGVITHQSPEELRLRFECPTDHVEDVVRVLTTVTRIGIVQAIEMDSVHHHEMGSDGG